VVGSCGRLQACRGARHQPGNRRARQQCFMVLFWFSGNVLFGLRG
jgi:hypothetical protein